MGCVDADFKSTRKLNKRNNKKNQIQRIYIVQCLAYDHESKRATFTI